MGSVFFGFAIHGVLIIAGLIASFTLELALILLFFLFFFASLRSWKRLPQFFVDGKFGFEIARTDKFERIMRKPFFCNAVWFLTTNILFLLLLLLLIHVF
jgi:hypothetical protein